MSDDPPANPLSQRFRGFLPVVVDVETTGLNPESHGLLEVCAVGFAMGPTGTLARAWQHHAEIIPHQEAAVDQEALRVNRVDLSQPRPAAKDEAAALREMLLRVREAVREANCVRAILVGHNAAFDLAFLRAAVTRCGIKRDPFHPFSTFDTCTLAGLAVGQTALAKACSYLGIGFDSARAHTAAYDAEITAELFCRVVNIWQDNPNRPPVLPQDEGDNGQSMEAWPGEER